MYNKTVIERERVLYSPLSQTLSEMWEVKRVRDISYGTETLGHLILKVAAHLAEQKARAALGERDTEVTIVTSVAPPGSGKSLWLAHIGAALTEVIPQIEQHTGQPVKAINLKWEAAEDEARAAGDIKTPIDKPYPLDERVKTDFKLQDMVISAMDQGSDLIAIELPADAATRIDEARPVPPRQLTALEIEQYAGWIGRFLGSAVLYNLARRRRPFDNRRYKLFPFGLKAGDLLYTYVLFSRTELKEARNFAEVRLVAARWGLPIPNTLAEAVKLQREGCAPETMYTLKEGKIRLLAVLCANDALQLHERDAFLLGKDPVYIRRVLIDHPHILRRVEAALLVKIFRDDLGIDPSCACIGLNNPGTEKFVTTFTELTPTDDPRNKAMVARAAQWQKLARTRELIDKPKKTGVTLVESSTPVAKNPLKK